MAYSVVGWAAFLGAWCLVLGCLGALGAWVLLVLWCYTDVVTAVRPLVPSGLVAF